MAFEIVERTVESETDKRALVSNTYTPLVRTMSVGTNWNKLRLGIRLSSQRSTAWTPAPYFYFGLCAGKTAPPGSLTPNHFAGIRVGGVNIGVSSGNPAWFANAHQFAGRCVIKNGTTTYNGSSAQGGDSYIREASQGRSAMFLEITKGSPWTLATWIHFGSGSASSTITPTQFRDGMSATSIPSPWANLTSVGGNITVDETTYGNLDTLCFVFLGASDPFEVSDIAYSVLS